MAAMLLPESHRGHGRSHRPVVGRITPRSQRRMGGAKRYPSPAFRPADGYRLRLHPSCGLVAGDDLREKIAGDVEEDRRGKGTESIRSIIPPWPSIMWPQSLAPRLRLTADSASPPSAPQTTISADISADCSEIGRAHV